MNKKKLAHYLSVLLGGMVWLPVVFYFIINRTGLTSDQLIIIAPTILILQVIIPNLYSIVAPKMGWASTWDIEKREERRPFFILIIILSLITFIVVSTYGNEIFKDFYAILMALVIIQAIITEYWKISTHSSLNTAGPIVINYFTGWKYLWLFLLIPVVFWARLQIKKHTIKQLYGGVIVTGGVILLGLLITGHI